MNLEQRLKLLEYGVQDAKLATLRMEREVGEIRRELARQADRDGSPQEAEPDPAVSVDQMRLGS